MDCRQILAQTRTALKPDTLSKRMLLILLIFFGCCCIKLCAADMSPEGAQAAREKFVAETKKYIGSPYVLGATGPDTFDCSGLVYYVARTALGIQLPRTARSLYNYCSIVSDSKREIGDLVFFGTTTSVTHVGIYIGNGQFISAISDGPNTGVIVSSLNQPYWQPKYVGTGQFLRRGTGSDDDSESGNDSNGEKIVRKSGGSFRMFDGISFDVTPVVGWKLDLFGDDVFQFKSVDVQANARFARWPLQPGLGFSVHYNHGLSIIQVPVFLSLTMMNDCLRVYVGPAFSFSNAALPDSDDTVQTVTFPGVIGVSAATPPMRIARAKFQLVQDFNFTVYNNLDGSVPFKFINAGFGTGTGLRITF